ncbi:hypothetical protein FHW08_002460 [Pantoea agglomerans]|jgi:hypothetical protein|nr:hypothetical protein [Pantoea agglomerans]MBA8874346.1 hypothetical protein [Pantoea agglomerans]
MFSSIRFFLTDFASETIPRWQNLPQDDLPHTKALKGHFNTIVEFYSWHGVILQPLCVKIIT